MWCHVTCWNKKNCEIKNYVHLRFLENKNAVSTFLCYHHVTLKYSYQCMLLIWFLQNDVCNMWLLDIQKYSKHMTQGRFLRKIHHLLFLSTKKKKRTSLNSFPIKWQCFDIKWLPEIQNQVAHRRFFLSTKMWNLKYLSYQAMCSDVMWLPLI